MPRKRKNAPPPEWLAPLQEWMRETRLALMSNGHFDDADALQSLTRDHGDEIAKLMQRGFMRRDKPALQSADASRAPFKQPPPDRVELLGSALQVEKKRRAILDDLSVDMRRRYCAAGEVIFVAYHAHKHGTRLERGGPHDSARDLNHPGDVVGIVWTTISDERKAHALAVGGKVLAAMKALYGCPRYRLTQALVKLVTGESAVVYRGVARALEAARVKDRIFFAERHFPTFRNAAIRGTTQSARS